MAFKKEHYAGPDYDDPYPGAAQEREALIDRGTDRARRQDKLDFMREYVLARVPVIMGTPSKENLAHHVNVAAKTYDLMVEEAEK